MVLVQRVDSGRITGIELDTGETKQFLTQYVKNLKHTHHETLPEAAGDYAEVIFAKMLGCHSSDVETYEINDKIYGLVVESEPKIKVGIAQTSVCLNPNNGASSVFLGRSLDGSLMIDNRKTVTPKEFIEYLTKSWL